MDDHDEDKGPNAADAASGSLDELARMRAHARETDSILNTRNCNTTRIWLVKVPDFIAAKWNEINETC